MTTIAIADRIEENAKARFRDDAAGIRTQIRATEATGDQLLEDTADLMKLVVKARRQHGDAPHTAQRAIMHLMKAQRSIVAAQNDVFRVHDELVKIQTTMMPDFPGSTEPSALTDQEMGEFAGSIAA